MTIKTNGGVFGRNPTFYNVNVDGKLTGGALRGSSLGIGVDSLSYLAEFAKASGNTYVMVNQTGASPSAILLGAEGTKNSIYSMTAPGNFTGKDLYLYRGSSLVFNTTSANNIAFPSGQGIDFSATAGTGTSELFSDYEEGTFVPTVYGGTTAGTTGYVSQIGLYTKTGRTVHVAIFLDWNSQSGTGSLNIGGLPFTSKQTFFQTAGSVTSSNLTFTAGASLACAIQPNATHMNIAESTNGAGQVYVSVDGAATVFVSASYIV